MIARTHNTNGHAGKLPSGIIDRIIELDAAYFERRQEREAASTYTAGTCDRMNPMRKGIEPRSRTSLRPSLADRILGGISSRPL